MKNTKLSQPWSLKLVLALAPLAGITASVFAFEGLHVAFWQTGFDSITSMMLIGGGILIILAGLLVMRTLIGKPWGRNTSWLFALGLFLLGFGGMWLFRIVPAGFSKRWLP